MFLKYLTLGIRMLKMFPNVRNSAVADAYTTSETTSGLSEMTFMGLPIAKEMFDKQ